MNDILDTCSSLHFLCVHQGAENSIYLGTITGLLVGITFSNLVDPFLIIAMQTLSINIGEWSTFSKGLAGNAVTYIGKRGSPTPDEWVI